jgi:hypothetical protein
MYNISVYDVIKVIKKETQIQHENKKFRISELGIAMRGTLIKNILL